MGSWTIAYPAELKTIKDGTSTNRKADGRKMYGVNASTDEGYTYDFASEYGGGYVAGWRFTFAENAGSHNPMRFDANEKGWIKPYKLPFRSRGGAIDFGWDNSDITFVIRFTGTNAETRRDEFFSVAKAKRAWDGNDAMAAKDPQTAPFLLFCGAQNRLRFVYVKSIRLIRDGSIGDNIWEYLVHMFDWQPHEYNAAIATDTFDLNLTFAVDEMIDQSQTDDDFSGDIDVVTELRAQQFIPGGPALTKVSVKLYKLGTPNGALVISIQGDNGSDEPDGVDLVSKNIVAGDVTTSAAVYTYDLPYTLTVGTKYWIVLHDSTSTNLGGSHEWLYRRENADDNYLNGVFKFSNDNGASWTATAKDLYFVTYVEVGGDISSYTELWIPATGIGNSTPDASGNGNTGTVYGTEIVDTPFGLGRKCNGIADYIDIGDIGSGIKTISFWMKADDVTSQKLINIDGTDHIEIDASDDVVATSFPAATVYVDGVAATAVTDATWHYITIVDTTGVSASTFQIARVGSDYGAVTINNVTALTTDLTAAQALAKYNEEVALITLTNAGYAPTEPSQVKFTGVTEDDFIDQQQTSTDAETNFGENDAVGKQSKVAQSFVPTKENLSKVGYVFKDSTGTFSGTVTIALQGDNAGDPDGTTVVSTTISNAVWEAKTDGQWYFEDLPYFTTPGTKFHIVFTASTADDANKPAIGAYDASDLYPEGSLLDWSTADGWAAHLDDIQFKTLYAEHTKNPGLYTKNVSDSTLEFGKESIFQSSTVEMSNAGALVGPAQWWGFTFQPTKTKISKVVLRLDVVGSSVGNLRVRLYEYDTAGNTHTGSVLATAYVSPHETNNLPQHVYINIIADGLDTTKTYILFCDDANADGSNYWNLYRSIVHSGLGDTNAGRQVFSANSGASWAESVVSLTTHKLYCPDHISCEIIGDGVVTINGDGTGTYQSVYTGSEIVFGALEISGTISTNSSGQLVFGADNDYAIYKFSSPYPLKNITLDYIVNPANNGVEVWVSKDNSTFELIKHVESGEGDDNVNQTVALSSTYDNIGALYVKFMSEGSSSAAIVRVGINTADIDTTGALMPPIDVGSNELYVGMDEISSGQAKVDVYYRQRR